MSAHQVRFIASFWEGEARQYANIISGYAQMLADPALRLDEVRRLEFAERIHAAQCAMTDLHAGMCDLLRRQDADR